MPAAIAFPLRLILFGDTDPFTQVFLGPLFEESIKLGATFLVLILEALFLPRGRDSTTALRYWLFLAPWLVGGLFGFGEGIVAYPHELGLNLSLREAVHASCVAWSLLVTLLVWRRLDAGAGGAILGGFAGFAAHIGFNLIAYLSGNPGMPFWDQEAYVGVLFVTAVLGLVLVLRHEPSSDEVRRFLSVPARA